LGTHGEIVKLADGSLWEVQYEYLYLYAYYPEAVVCPSQGKLIVDAHAISVVQISAGGRASTRSNAIIEARIDGEFSGWDGETIFKLDNGQIWQQTSYAYTYHYAYRPKIMLIHVNGHYEMQVEGVSSRIAVTRLQ
jgi:hypothetical protein